MRTCPVDGTPLNGRADQRYCSERCSKKARRGQSVVPMRRTDEARTEADLPSLAESVREELRRAGAESSGLGVSALLLAAQIDSRQESGSSLAALNRELRATLAEATRGQVKSGLASLRDELAERRRGA
jgi:hypothetical protein